MSFLFGGKKHKQQHQGSALPPATREISSSHGPGERSQGPGSIGSQEKGRPGPQPQPQQNSAPNSVNTSLSSLNAPSQQSPDAPAPRTRERSDSDFQVSPRQSPGEGAER